MPRQPIGPRSASAAPTLIRTSVNLFSANTVATMLFLFSSIFIGRTLGASGHGTVFLLATSAALISLIASLGVHQGVVYLVARRPAHITIVPTALLFATIVSACLFIAGLVGLEIFFDINGPARLDEPPIFLAACLPPLYFYYLVIEHILLGARRFQERNIARILTEIVRVSLIALTVGAIGLSINSAIFAFVFATAIGVGYMLMFTPTLFNRRPMRRARLITLRSLLGFGLKAHIGNILAVVAYRVDVFIVTYFLGVQEVGLYFVSVQLAQVLLFIPNAIGNILFSLASNRPDDFQGIYVAAICRHVWLITAGAAAMLAGAGWLLIAPVFGSAFSGAILPLVLLMPGVVALSIHKVLIFALMASGKPGYVGVTGAFVLLLVIGLGLWLVPGHGLMGAAIASSLAYCVGAILTIAIFVREYRIGLMTVIRPRREDFRGIILFVRNLTQRGRWHA